MAKKRRPSRAVAIVHRKRIIAEVAKARLIREIAADYGIKKPNISKHLAHDPAYRKAREKAAAIRLDRAKRAMVDLAMAEAGRSISLRKARKAYLYALWYCQSNFPERWPVPKFELRRRARREAS